MKKLRPISNLADNKLAVLHGAVIIDCYVLCAQDESDTYGEQALLLSEFITNKYNISKPILVSSTILGMLVDKLTSVETTEMSIEPVDVRIHNVIGGNYEDRLGLADRYSVTDFFGRKKGW